LAESGKPRTQLLAIGDAVFEIDACYRSVDYVRSTKYVPQLYAKSIKMLDNPKVEQMILQHRQIESDLYMDLLKEKSKTACHIILSNTQFFSRCLLRPLE
jgi:hypothetical protein